MRDVTTTHHQAAVRILAALSLTAATLAGTAASATAATPLTVASTVGVPGTLPGGAFSQPLAAEAPDGTVFVVTSTSGGAAVYSVSPAGVVHLADKVTGPVTALAADASTLYVGTRKAISSYQRSNGKLLRQWPLSPTPRGLSQLAVAGNRVWGLLTPVGIHPAPSSLVELDPTQAARVATVNGVADTERIAATTTGIEYVTAKSTTLVRRSNTGVVTSTKTLLAVNLSLSGPAAIQAEVVSAGRLFVKFSAGQGLDAVTYTYNATTLAGPLGPAAFNAEASLGVTMSSGLGLLETAAPGDLPCTSGVHPCIARYGSGGVSGAALSLPYDEASAPLGPVAAVVVTKGTTQKVLRLA
ncbi:hypothetical protein acdb102_03320 [Acidothermaceae bacterium B102]|nr:hypothetical protein acdb102_03320 [Acidothermaceae bacterium B102]